LIFIICSVLKIKKLKEEIFIADLKIRVFRSGKTEPETTVTIPGGVLQVASKLIPKQVASSLFGES